MTKPALPGGTGRINCDEDPACGIVQNNRTDMEGERPISSASAACQGPILWRCSSGQILVIGSGMVDRGQLAPAPSLAGISDVAAPFVAVTVTVTVSNPSS